ncbi:MAG: acetate/propionate family kinase [Pseudomonadota bacterium]
MAADWILTLNAGSSSLKLGVYGRGGEAIAHDQVSEIDVMHLPRERVAQAVSALIAGRGLAERPAAVGHRVVHGLDIHQPGEIDAPMRERMERACAFAPLHNPPALHVIDHAEALFPQARHVAGFDTAFHADNPAVETTFPIPEELRAHGVRRYGFHGLSYASLTRRFEGETGRPLPGRLLACHLGAGSSMTAIRDGRSAATTMGFSPMEGLVMATRCGELDPGVIFHLMREGWSADELERKLNRESGLKALGGTGSMKELLARDDEAARFAVEHYCHWAIRHAGALIAVLGGVEAIAFTGGIGEHAEAVRARILNGLRWAGLGEETCHVIPADEAGELAEAARRVLDEG